MKSRRRILDNAVVNLLRIGVNAAMALALPAYMTSRMSVSTYAAWVLILQMAAFVNYLDIGIQTAIAKYIAQHHAVGETERCNQAATAGARLLWAASVLGVLMVFGIAAFMPYWVRDISGPLLWKIQASTLIVGVSTTVLLAASCFNAIFMGMERYRVPTLAAVTNRALYSLAIVVCVGRHSDILVMAVCVAVINIATAALQWILCRRAFPEILLNASLAGSHLVREMLGYCAVLAVWSAGMLCVGGLDLTIVSHFDLKSVAYYSIAAAPANFLVMLLSAGLGPLIPAVSALHQRTDPDSIGRRMAQITRYGSVFLVLAGMALVLWGGVALRLWVGPAYAAHSLTILRILVLAVILRNLLAPYAAFVVAVGRQRFATWSVIGEAVVNLVASLLLAQRYGAIGVAVGTLLGSIVGVAVHLLVSMPATAEVIRIRVHAFLRAGLAHTLPLLALSGGVYWLAQHRVDAHPVPLAIAWLAAAALLSWSLSLDRGERQHLAHLGGNFVHRRKDNPRFTGVAH